MMLNIIQPLWLNTDLQRESLVRTIWGKFLRVDEKLYQYRLSEIHSDGAGQDGIRDDIRKLKIIDPTKVDGGKFLIKPNGTITVYDFSVTFEIPPHRDWEPVREETQRVFEILSPGFIVMALDPRTQLIE